MRSKSLSNRSPRLTRTSISVTRQHSCIAIPYKNNLRAPKKGHNTYITCGWWFPVSVSKWTKSGYILSTHRRICCNKYLDHSRDHFIAFAIHKRFLMSSATEAASYGECDQCVCVFCFYYSNRQIIFIFFKCTRESI